MMKYILTFMVAASFVGLPSHGRAADIGTPYRSQYYDIYYIGAGGPGRDVVLVDIARRLDALYVHLIAHFRKAPPGRMKGRMQVEIYANPDDFKKVANQVGGRWSVTMTHGAQLGGFFSPSSKTLYVNYGLARTSEGFYRTLFHEATHQFHLLGLAEKQQSMPPPWYTEGIASYFGGYRWDGRLIQKGELTSPYEKHDLNRALRVLEGCQWDVESIVTDRRKATSDYYPVWWVLVHFLMKEDHIKFSRLAERLNNGAAAPTAWSEVYGVADARFVERFRKWLQSHQPPSR